MTKHNVRKLLGVALTAAMLVSIVPAAEPLNAAGKTKLKTKNVTLYKGRTKKIVLKNKKKKRTYLYSSNKKKVATVSKKGLIRAKKAGKAVITVKEKYTVKKKKKKRRIGKVKVTVKNKTYIPPDTSNASTKAPTGESSSPQTSSVPTDTATPAVTEMRPPTPSPTPYVPPFLGDDTEAQLYVAPSGNDSADGSREHPFRTLARAKEAVRELDKSKGDIIVLVANGFYPVKDTIQFSSQDSGNDKCTIHYRAVKNAKPVFAGGEKLETDWRVADDVNWLSNGLKAYKTPLNRKEKLRAIYVNGKRASMTSKTKKPKSGVGKYKVKKGQADWAWNSSTTTIYEGATFDSSFLPADTRNPQNIELESGSTWAKQLVCAQSLSKTAEGDTQVSLQMPYAALAQRDEVHLYLKWRGNLKWPRYQ